MLGYLFALQLARRAEHGTMHPTAITRSVMANSFKEKAVGKGGRHDSALGCRARPIQDCLPLRRHVADVTVTSIKRGWYCSIYGDICCARHDVDFL